MRYVDDVRLFGASEDDVRADLIELERHCRERGLIPQTGENSRSSALRAFKMRWGCSPVFRICTM